ncbi:hypothetical protein ETB97_004287 [Aspergillus alliaceus]|uniref:Uncharacterized protein n=1 Tax=Petromyces alliaceus TaxID=209559 RepID=A0A8H6A1U1_PETAA|nr:hypothetical protein ETB97_004287 [Aspergillus burnettii]
MAPRRGGSSWSYGSSSSSSSSSCRSGAFSSQHAQIIIAFHGLFFLVFIALFCITTFRFLRSKQKKTALQRWFPFGFSIVFMVLGVIISIVTYVLLQCDISSINVYSQVNIAAQWFSMVATFLLIALIMIPICTRLVQGSPKIAKAVTTVHSLYVAMLAIVLLCDLSIYTRVIDATRRGGFNSSDLELPEHQKRLATAYHVLSVIGMLMASANMLFALARGHHLRKGILLPAIPLLIVSSLGMTILDLAHHIITRYLQEEYVRKGIAAYNRSLQAQLFLAYFFYASAFLAALLVASSRQLADNVSGPVKHIQQQPKYNGAMPVQQPYRAYPPQPQHQPQAQPRYQ